MNYRITLRMFDQLYFEKIRREETSRMNKAVRHLANEVKKFLSKRVGKSKRRVTARSKRGEAPRLETGELRRSIAVEVETGNRIIGRVGTNKKYAKFLEVNYNRPFLSAALRLQRNNIAKILLGQKIT